MRVLSLGAGQQSTAVYLLAANGDIPPLDYAIFADTGEEPSWVYEQVEALQAYRTPAGKPGAPILVRWLNGKTGERMTLGENLLTGNSGRFASIPAFTKNPNMWTRSGENEVGKTLRQCTSEFKINVVERTIRRELLGLKHGEAYRGERITQVFGFDFSEGERIFRTKGSLALTPLSVGDFPLWDLQWKRVDCEQYILEVWGREVLPSACTFCPLVNAAFRRLIRDRDPEGHKRACAVDAGLRMPGAAASKMLDGELYIHRSMKPLAEVDLDANDERGLLPLMTGCLTGYCGH